MSNLSYLGAVQSILWPNSLALESINVLITYIVISAIRARAVPIHFRVIKG